MRLLVKIGMYFAIAIALLLGATYFVANTYKKEILAAVNKEFSKRLNGELTIKDVDYSLLADFPNFSFTLVEPVVTDSLYPVHRQQLFHADNMYLQLSLLKLIENQIHIQSIILQNAEVFLFRTKNGVENWHIFKSDSAAAQASSEREPMDFMLNKVGLRNVAVSYVDSTSDKTIQFKLLKLQTTIHAKEHIIGLKVTGPVVFNQFTFNPKKGTYLQNTNATLSLDLAYNKQAQQLDIHKSIVTINNLDYPFEGSLSMGKPAELSLTFYSDKARLSDITPLLTRDIAAKLNRFEIKQPVKASARIATKLVKGYLPEVEVLFATNGADVTYKELEFKEVKLNGRFYDKADTIGKAEDNAFIEVKDFFARYENLPIEANYTITHLKEPNINLQAVMRFSLNEANNFLDKSKMVFDKGKADINFSYQGKLHKVLDETNAELPGILKGNVSLNEADFSYAPRQFHFTKINGSLRFNQSDAILDSIKFLVNDNPVIVTGKIDELVPFALYRQSKLKADMQMYSPVFNFNKFKSPGSLRKLGLLKEKRSQQSTARLKRAIAQKIEAVIDMLESHLSFTIDKIEYRKFIATNIQGDVILEDNAVQLNNVAFASSDGLFKLNGSIRDLSQPQGQLDVHAAIDGADVRKLFYSFENFKQTTLEDKNLMGDLHANINFSSAFDDSYTIFPETMQGDFEVQLNNGRLIDFEPLSKISKIVFKERDFTNIEFADIRNNFSLQGQELQISRMEIASSVFTLFVGGTFSFDKETDLSIQLPLSNLSLKEDKDIVPEKIGVQNAGASIYLRARAATAAEKVKISYDPFKKGLKENQLEENKKPRRKKHIKNQT